MKKSIILLVLIIFINSCSSNNYQYYVNLAEKQFEMDNYQAALEYIITAKVLLDNTQSRDNIEIKKIRERILASKDLVEDRILLLEQHTKFYYLTDETRDVLLKYIDNNYDNNKIECLIILKNMSDFYREKGIKHEYIENKIYDIEKFLGLRF